LTCLRRTLDVLCPGDRLTEGLNPCPQVQGGLTHLEESEALYWRAYRAANEAAERFGTSLGGSFYNLWGQLCAVGLANVLEALGRRDEADAVAHE
jgi:hypothetical protein